MSENHAGRPHPEHVVLEIGDELGALIVYTDADRHGTEVEISRSDMDDTRSHKDVLERSLGGRPTFAAVFDQLEQGTYTLWTDNAVHARNVTVSGGAVTEVDWRTNGEPQNRAPAHAP
jgi:hypothetical protein